MDFDVPDYNPMQGDQFSRAGKTVHVEGPEKISEVHGIRWTIVEGELSRLMWSPYLTFVQMARRSLKHGATLTPGPFAERMD